VTGSAQTQQVGALGTDLRAGGVAALTPPGLVLRIAPVPDGVGPDLGPPNKLAIKSFVKSSSLSAIPARFALSMASHSA